MTFNLHERVQFIRLKLLLTLALVVWRAKWFCRWR